MKQVPSGTELARPFMPAKDFDLSKNFYETLGFEKLLDGDVPIRSWSLISGGNFRGGEIRRNRGEIY